MSQANYQYLSTGYLKARLSNNAMLLDSFWVPNADGTAHTSALSELGLWIGGTDAAGNLKLDIQSKGWTSNDFETGFKDKNGSNQVWAVSGADIAQHLDDFDEDGDIDNPIPSIFAWPGAGNAFSEQYNGFSMTGVELEQGAPFWDKNLNKQYEPNIGEYPMQGLRMLDIEGHNSFGQLIFAPFFTKMPLDPFASRGGFPLGGSVQWLTYDCPESDFMQNTLFGSVKLLYHNSYSMDSTNITVFADMNAGSPEDDYIGTDADQGMTFFYNGDAEDNWYSGPAPMIGLVTEYARPEPTSFTHYLWSRGITPILRDSAAFVVQQMPNPNYPIEIYSYLTGGWRDGLPLTVGNTGHNIGSMEYTNYAFPGALGDTVAWTEINAGNVPGNRAALMRYNPVVFPAPPSQEAIKSHHFNVVLFHVPPMPTPVEQQARLNILSEAAHEWLNFSGHYTPFWANWPCLAPLTPTTEENPDDNISIAPNPTSGRVELDFGQKTPDWIKLYDVYGREIKTMPTPLSPNIKLDLSNTPSGVYYLYWQNGSTTGAKKLLITH